MEPEPTTRRRGDGEVRMKSTFQLQARLMTARASLSSRGAHVVIAAQEIGQETVMASLMARYGRGVSNG